MSIAQKKMLLLLVASASSIVPIAFIVMVGEQTELIPGMADLRQIGAGWRVVVAVAVVFGIISAYQVLKVRYLGGTATAPGRKRLKVFLMSIASPIPIVGFIVFACKRLGFMVEVNDSWLFFFAMIASFQAISVYQASKRYYRCTSCHAEFALYRAQVGQVFSVDACVRCHARYKRLYHRRPTGTGGGA